MRATIVFLEQVNVGSEQAAKIKLRPVTFKDRRPLTPTSIVPGSRVSYYVRYSENGKRVTKSLQESDLGKAHTEYLRAKWNFENGVSPVLQAAVPSELLADFKANRDSSSEKTWSQLYTAFLANLDREVMKGEIKPSTRKTYTRKLRNLNTFLAARIHFVSEITPDLLDAYNAQRQEEIQAFLVKKWESSTSPFKPAKPRKAGRAYDDMVSAHKLFEFAVNGKWIQENPVTVPSNGVDSDPDYNDEERGAEPFEDEEIAAMKNANDLTFWLAYRTGLRASDLISLKWRHVDFKTGTITKDIVKRRVNSKNKALTLKMFAPLPDLLKKVFDERKPSPEDYILLKDGRGMNYKQLYRAVVTLGERFDIKAHPHRFRDTFVVWALMLTAPNGEKLTVEEVARMIGDEPETVREHYAKWTTGREERMWSVADRAVALEVA